MVVHVTPVRAEALLSGAKTEPARTVGGPEIARTDTGGALNSFLSGAEFAIDERRAI